MKTWYWTSIIKGSVVGFTILSVLMPGVFTACSRGQDGIDEYLETTKIEVTAEQLVDAVNKAMDFPDMLVLAGV